MPEPLILAIDPGSTSTRLGLFRGAAQEWVTTIPHGDDLLHEFRGRPIADQLDMRTAECESALAERSVVIGQVQAVVGRGGLLPALPSGTYHVDAHMLADLGAAARGEHASNLGAMIAARLAERAGCDAFIVDPVSVDEWDQVARLSGMAELERESLSHALNTKAIAKRYAREIGRRYEELRLVVIHCGRGTTVSAHREGRMVDACNSREEGPFAMDRAGSMPALKLLAYAFDSGVPRAELERRLYCEGGIYSYLGTRELREVLARINAGDQTAALVLDALLYQTAKEAGAMAAVLNGRVDAVLLTGGMMHAGAVAVALADRVRWIAPTRVYPGEDELRALAEGALRVLGGEERARSYPG